MQKKKWKASLLKHRKTTENGKRLFLLVDFNDKMRGVDAECGEHYAVRKNNRNVYYLAHSFRTLEAAKRYRKSFIAEMAKPEYSQ